MKVDTKRQRLRGQFPVFTLEGNIYLEVKLAPRLSYAFHIEAQSIKGDVKPPLLMFNNASCYGPRQGTGSF